MPLRKFINFIDANQGIRSMDFEIESYAAPAVDTGEPSLRNTIGALLLRVEDRRPTLQQLAAALNVSTRTLDRRLRREGIGFRDLALQIRSQRACVLLGETGLSISEIAYALGYTDIANFSRSFKKVAGMCPMTYRKALFKSQT